MVQENAGMAMQLAGSLREEPSMVGPLFDFYGKHGTEESLEYLEQCLLRYRDSRSLRQFQGWLENYNRAILRLEQRPRSQKLYARLLQDRNKRIRTLASEFQPDKPGN
jgi:hypothetical protein